MVRQIEAQFSAGQSLRLIDEIGLVLQGGNLLKQRNDAIEPTFDLLFVLPQTRIGCTIGKRMLRPGDRQG